MGHHVIGVIAASAMLEEFAATHSLHSPIALNADLAMLPLRDEDIDSLLATPQTRRESGFRYLSEQLVRFLQAASLRSPILYFETDYSGGAGSQGAVVFRDGRYGLRTKTSPCRTNQRSPRNARSQRDTAGFRRVRNDWAAPPSVYG